MPILRLRDQHQAPAREVIEILYLAWNRLEFTQATFAHLLANTDWEHVSRLVVYDDGSIDGTIEHLNEAIQACPVEHEMRYTGYRSPVKVMLDYLSHTETEMFAKIDNDIGVPPGWLPTCLDVMERYPDVMLLGAEGGMLDIERDGWDGIYRVEPSTHIGGVGLMRAAPFRSRRKMHAYGRRNGFTEWQHRNRDVERGWITPMLRFCCFDRLPIEPWVSLSERYIEMDWQRPWGKYDPKFPYWWEWFTPQEEAA